jgi:hypothetical protein
VATLSVAQGKDSRLASTSRLQQSRSPGLLWGLVAAFLVPVVILLARERDHRPPPRG